VLQLDHPGVSSQRQLGVDWATQSYVAVVDAHHVLEPDCLSILLKEMEWGHYQAIQARELCKEKGYWTEARTSANKAITHRNVVEDTDMVGRPALYKTSVLRACGFDSAFNGVGDEDTDLAIRMQSKGYWQGIGTGVAYRIDKLTFWGMVHKFVKYGRGDARLIRKHPHKRWAIIKHLLWTYPIVRSFQALRRGDGKYVPYFVLCGLVRFIAMEYEWGAYVV